MKIKIIRILPLAMALMFIAAVIAREADAASTYYVRTDGGLASVCNGTANAPASAAPNCAWSSPMEALPPTLSNYPHPARIKGGDTLIIEPGQYRIGWTAGVYDQQHMQDPCDGAYAAGCTTQPVPSGTAAQPTRIVGAGWDSGCTAKPQLYGVQAVNQVLDLDGASNVVIACLDLTDHAYCTYNYSPDKTYACDHTWVAYGQPANYGDWADKAIHAQDSSNITLQDLNIHGFADQGVQAGRISNWTVTRVTVAGNGMAGWNGDLGGNNHNSTNSGTLVFTDFTVKWNGCQEHYPADGKFDLCFGQEQGGYGDGLGEAWTGGNWTFIRPQFYRNTSDGLDLLYANGTGSIMVDHGFFARNVGNDLKTSGNTVVTNSVFIAQCSVFSGTSEPVAPNPCRAGGGEFADFAAPNETITFGHNTVVGEAGCLYGGDPTYFDGSGSVVASDTYAIHDNIFVVKPKWNGDGQACLFWAGDPPNNPATVKWTNNLVWPAPREDGRCTTAGITCIDPKLKDETLATFDWTLLPGSPAIGTGTGVQP